VRQEVLVANLFKKFVSFYCTRKFDTVSEQPPPPEIVPSLSQINLVHALSAYSFKMNINIIISPMHSSFKWFLSIRFPYQNLVCISLLSQTCHAPARLSHADVVCRAVQVTVLFSSSLCSFRLPHAKVVCRAVQVTVFFSSSLCSFRLSHANVVCRAVQVTMLFSSSLCSFRLSPVISSPLGPNIPLPLLSNALSCVPPCIILNFEPTQMNYMSSLYQQCCLRQQNVSLLVTTYVTALLSRQLL
jgi:hypothetical protein